MSEMIDLEEMKSEAYDCIRELERLQIRLRDLNRQIQEVEDAKRPRIRNDKEGSENDVSTETRRKRFDPTPR